MNRVTRHLELHRQGVGDFRSRSLIISHERWIERLRLILKKSFYLDHNAYLEIRAQTAVFDLIEADGERMIEALTVRGNFTQEEVTLVRK